VTHLSSFCNRHNINPSMMMMMMMMMMISALSLLAGSKEGIHPACKTALFIPKGSPLGQDKAKSGVTP